ncbi:aminotransferase class I/II-fold pyridoxal phosphate-dependent enzyme [Campylobacter sp. faydin G-24]|uniref:Aminotransferase class I/II-fold pyridoxal phosphate-dependent enzyme n=1 Tax=Campylobacter anatolicus TaxID=2829105 RepID=A0ABS5HIL2_9BACT|nr:aminotransferase class I/II-fold pyridoxal phosphate-dependent enzyme [Campylobacter anatolicus]MBR8462721.1 aminotransferase class I/II-fold pyridoxal phosphate-dependent enzyme [Campylobacter anatolicus]MBR8464111.1 aminotransferase class I/II-fold pyridoxal phosphate-dependent enzyme [Campylobacter anatolicus]
MKQESIAIHAGYDTKQGTGAMAVPIYSTTAFDFGTADTAANRFALAELGPIYSRLTNPTLDILETRFAEFDGGAAAISTSSGQAAMFFAVANLAAAGDNIILASKVYGGATSLFTHTMKRFGLQTRIFDADSADELENLIDDKTKAIFFESLSNPQIAIPNIEKITQIAKKHRVVTIVDNTVATPVLFAPFSHGIDMAVYSVTKYVGGQGNALGGMIVSSKELNALLKGNPRYPHFNEPDESYHGLVFASLPEIFDINTLRIRVGLMRDIGAVLSPDSAFKIIQGLETLSIRMQKHCENALKVAEFLSSHNKVKAVNYPGLKSDKFNDRAKKYLKDGLASALISFDVGDKEIAKHIINSTKLFKIVVNIGDTKSLITHPASTTHSQLSEAELNANGIGAGVIRLSIGIENADDLIADLKQALDA